MCRHFFAAWREFFPSKPDEPLELYCARALFALLIARSGWSHPPCEPLDMTIQREHVKPQFMPARSIE
jgi:hypothetical protein